MLSFDLIGLNRRNIEYITKYNNRKHFPLVDDKIVCKDILNSMDIPCPKTIGVVSHFVEIKKAINHLRDESDFVIKPSRGRAGGGIKLLTTDNRQFYTLSGNPVSADDMSKHLGDILFGVYSFGKMNDSALIEEKINQHSMLNSLYPQGVADIRVILLKGEPVMAMLRVPSSSSDGKANLHQGALGIGVDIETGITTHASVKGESITHHPDTKEQLINLKIPHFKDVIEYSRKASTGVPLGYLGVDIVLDDNKGPMILEMNARPGLQIQVVNQKCLGPILAKMENS